MIREVTPGLVDYRRNFLPETIAGIDVVTELTYATQAAFDQAMDLAARPPISETIAADHANLFDPAGVTIVVVDERTA
jgi:hypothetical protein